MKYSREIPAGVEWMAASYGRVFITIWIQTNTKVDFAALQQRFRISWPQISKIILIFHIGNIARLEGNTLSTNQISISYYLFQFQSSLGISLLWLQYSHIVKQNFLNIRRVYFLGALLISSQYLLFHSSLDFVWIGQTSRWEELVMASNAIQSLE